MSSKKPEKSKSGRKKLTLSKETLKDLTTNAAQAKGVHGGRPMTQTNVCSF